MPEGAETLVFGRKLRYSRIEATQCFGGCMAAYTDSRSARKEERKLLPVWYRVLSLVLTIAAIGVAAFAFGTVLVSRASEDGSNLFGYVVLTVESGSMSPALEEGDVIAGRAYDGGELVVGDIVTFRAPSGVFKGRYITHRIAEVGEEDGVAVYRTKGDAANSVDSWTLKGEDIVAVYEKKLPTVKKVAEFMSGAGGRMLMIGLPVILLVGVFVADSVVSRRLATKIKAEREAAAYEAAAQEEPEREERHENDGTENAPSREKTDERTDG